MAVTLNETEFSRAESTTGWTPFENAAGTSTGQGGSNGIPAKEGSGSVEFHLTGAGQSGGLQSPAIPAFNMVDREVGLWFLNPGEEDGGAQLLRNATDSLFLRVWHSGGQTDFDQSYLRLPDGNWNNGWLYLRATGNLIGVTNIAPRVFNCNAPNNAKQDLEYQIDYAKSYDKIIVTGVETLDSIYQASLTNDWGLVEKNDNRFSFNCGIEFASGCTFVAENQDIFLNHYSDQFKQNIIVKAGANVRFGRRSQPSVFAYAQDGCQIKSPETPLIGSGKAAPDFLVEDGANFSCYDTLIQGFGNVLFGQNNTSPAVIDIIKVNLYDNNNVEFRSTALDADDLRINQDSADIGNIGAVFFAPNSFRNIQAFNCVNALQFEVSCLVEGYTAQNTVNDAVIRDGADVEFRNSDLDFSKLLRVA